MNYLSFLFNIKDRAIFCDSCCVGFTIILSISLRFFMENNLLWGSIFLLWEMLDVEQLTEAVENKRSDVEHTACKVGPNDFRTF